MEKIQITSSGIKKALKKYDYKKAISEFIWNGFDAQATSVNLVYKADEIGAISELKIIDNGCGINKDKLSDKFTPVFESDKALDQDIQRNTSATHGKNGVGRLTFFRFANEASWNTTYQSDGMTLNYTIHIDANTLNSYESSVPKPTSGEPGTTVSFYGLSTIGEHSFKSEIRDYLIREFCWYLELNSRKSYTILINGIPLDYSKNVGDKEVFHFDSEQYSFEIDYLRWDASINDEFSRYYYIDSQDEEKFKETTKLNYQSDGFFHSIYIRSIFFNDLQRPLRTDNSDDSQADFLGFKRAEKAFKDLMKYIGILLRNKRKPFLAESTNKLITEFRKEGVFPPYGQSEWDRVRRFELEQAVRSIYQYEPKVFASLNIEQKKIITRFLDLIIDTDEKDRVLDIIAEIINLTKEERAEFAQILQASKMSSIIKTVRLIEDRYRAIDQLRQLVSGNSFSSGLSKPMK